MLVPVRCFTCGALVEHLKYEKRRTKGELPITIFKELGIQRECCRRMLLGIPDGLTNRISSHSAKDIEFPESQSTLKLHMPEPRVVTCE